MRCRRLLILTPAVAVAALSLLAAGCGSGDSSGVGSVASSTTAATTRQTGARAFAHCMRSRGVPTFPDPDSSGGFPKPQVVDARKSDPSRFDPANSACRHLLPNGGNGPAQTITPGDRGDYVRAAACVRSHGFPDFPDPTFQNNNVRVDIPSSINQDSSQFKSAARICTRLIPAGLPYSRSNTR
jgi:hypothetical protein